MRLWPSPEYSRITFELAEAAAYKYFQPEKIPTRLVWTSKGVEPEGALLEIAGQRSPRRNPQIASIRVARNRPGITRVVGGTEKRVSPPGIRAETDGRLWPPPWSSMSTRLSLDIVDKQCGGQQVVDKQVEAAIGKSGKEATEKLAEKPAAAAKAAEGKEAKAGNPSMSASSPSPSMPATAARIPAPRAPTARTKRTLTLSIARRVKSLIDKQENMRAFLTRDGDYFIPLHERVNKARRAQADLFVSIHADAFRQGACARLLGVRACRKRGRPPPRPSGWRGAKTRPT